VLQFDDMKTKSRNNSKFQTFEHLNNDQPLLQTNKAFFVMDYFLHFTTGVKLVHGLPRK